jgi:hypothetical protein
MKIIDGVVCTEVMSSWLMDVGALSSHAAFDAK